MNNAKYLSDEQFNTLLEKQRKTNKTNLILSIVLPIIFLVVSLSVFLIVFFVAS
jgi:hypothetical protein